MIARATTTFPSSQLKRVRLLGSVGQKGNQMQTVKGMVQVAGSTYRIVRLGSGKYQVVRILDDKVVGTFQSAPKVEVTSSQIEAALLLEIARAAVQGAKTSWVGRLNLP